MAGIGRTVRDAVAAARDAIARVLMRLGVNPNTLSVVGLLITLATAACLILGAGHRFAWDLDGGDGRSAYLVIAFVLMLAGFACDMLDGAVARIGGKATPFGAFLDSTLDRFSDFAIFGGIAVHYATAEPANITFIALAMLALVNAYMISYTRARAEDLIPECKVGYWQRGERSTAVLLAAGFYNIPAVLIQLGILPLFTALRRIAYTHALLAGKKPVTDPRNGGFRLKIRLWRWPRMTFGYDVVTIANIAWVIFARVPARDVLRDWLM
ncbi:MAG: CDP-alcohol phosphatidyltransferase family protein [Planctomycetota bacterium]